MCICEYGLYLKEAEVLVIQTRDLSDFLSIHMIAKVSECFGISFHCASHHTVNNVSR
jgi:hypothetical protein